MSLKDWVSAECFGRGHAEFRIKHWIQCQSGQSQRHYTLEQLGVN